MQSLCKLAIPVLAVKPNYAFTKCQYSLSFYMDLRHDPLARHAGARQTALIHSPYTPSNKLSGTIMCPMLKFMNVQTSHLCITSLPSAGLASWPLSALPS